MESNQKLSVVLEIEKNGRLYSFTMPMGAPHGEVYDCLFSLLQDVLELSKKASDKMQPNPQVEPQVEG